MKTWQFVAIGFAVTIFYILFGVAIYFIIESNTQEENTTTVSNTKTNTTSISPTTDTTVSSDTRGDGKTITTQSMTLNGEPVNK